MKTGSFPPGHHRIGSIRQNPQKHPNQNGREYTSYVGEYTLLGKRKREWRSDLFEARRAASDACQKIAYGEHCILELSGGVAVKGTHKTQSSGYDRIL